VFGTGLRMAAIS